MPRARGVGTGAWRATITLWEMSEMLLNTLECALCERKASAANFNQLVWWAKDNGWRLALNEATVEKAVCPQHEILLNDEGGFEGRVTGMWQAGCYTCDWEESFFTQEEAKQAMRLHDCRDWLDCNDTWTKSPQQQLEDATRQEQYRQEAHDRQVAQRLAEERRVEQTRHLHELAEYGERYLRIKNWLTRPWAEIWKLIKKEN